VKAKLITKQTIKLSLTEAEADIVYALLSGVESKFASDDVHRLAVQVKHMLEEFGTVTDTCVTFSDLFEGEIVIK
jgi:hypothetical protein